MNNRFQSLVFFVAAVLFNACTSNNKPINPITAEDIKSHIAVLANDSLTGRKPFTSGETKTINYISQQFKKIGLDPGNHGSYFQDVPMVEITGSPSPTMQITGPESSLTLTNLTDFVASTEQELNYVELKKSPVVFAGYGVVAPEYHWNDYSGLDVKGKTVIVLVNDPRFKGDTMTYYGRWTYKYEEAARQGAAGVIIVHQTKAASYPWSVVASSFPGSKLYLQQKDKHLGLCKVQGWITEEAAAKVLKAAGITGDVRAMAAKKGFKAIPLDLTIDLNIHNKLKYAMSHNVIGILKGSAQPDESIIYSAHWDHLGVGKPDAKGDSIYNGAVDNADGVASLLSMAKAFTEAKTKTKRSIVFLAVTAEEQGLLGSEYYATHPVYPLNKTIANLNMDALGSYGETKDIAITGKGQNDLDDYVLKYAQAEKLQLVGDRNPGSGSYYRSDHFSFAKVGVPALDMNNGDNSLKNGADWGKKQQQEYTAHHYHQPSDNYTPDMDATGMAQVANLLYNVGYQLSNETSYPGWKNGSEFKAIREKSLGK